MGIQVVQPVGDESLVLPAVAWIAGVCTAVLGGSALIGWALESQLLKQIVPGLPSTKPTAAVCLILLGIAVTTILRRPRRQWVGPAATAGAGLLAGVSLLEYALDRDLLIDRLLFRGAVDRDPYGGRMALSAAVEFALMVAALVAVLRGKRKAAQGLGLIVFAGGAVAVLGYAYGERRLYAPDAQTGMAFNTALGLTLVSLGLLASIPDGVLTHLFRRPTPGAMLSRRLLPWITIVMPVLGWARLEGERRGLFGAALGTSIMVFVGSIAVTVTARLAAVSMDRLAVSLHHAWHQYGLASARQHTPNPPSSAPPQLTGGHERITIDSDEELQQIRLDR
jgi:hypothetical protein